jgi:hypothetical protein
LETVTVLVADGPFTRAYVVVDVVTLCTGATPVPVRLTLSVWRAPDTVTVEVATPRVLGVKV